MVSARYFQLFILFCSASMAAGDSEAASGNCSGTIELSSSSLTEWQVSCSTDKALTTVFDPQLLTSISINKVATVEFTANTAPQPIEVHIPAAFARIGELQSTTVTKLDIGRSLTLRGRSVVTIESNAFAKMKGLKKLTMGGFNVTIKKSHWVVPASLNELSITQCGLGKFDVKVEGNALNLTRVDLSNSDLTALPDFLFTTNKFQWVNLLGVKFPPLKISARRYARLLRLLAAAKLQISSVANYTGTCEGGEKKTVKSMQSFLLCVTKEGEDGLVVGDDENESSSSGSISANGIVVSPTGVIASSDNSITPTPTATKNLTTSGGVSSARFNQHFTALAVTVTVLCALFASS